MPYPQVPATMSKGVFNPVVYRPLFECSGHGHLPDIRDTGRRDHPAVPARSATMSRRSTATRAAELVLGGEQPHDKIVDVLARPEHYAEIVMAIREDFRQRHSPEARLRELDWYHRGMTLDAEDLHDHREPELHEPAADARRMQLRYGFNEIDGWWRSLSGEHRETIRRRLQLDGHAGRPRLRVRPAGARPDQGMALVCRRAAGRARRRRQADDDVRQVPSALRQARATSAISSPAAREIVWGCIEQWGGEEVKDWYWCVWNEPNNPDHRRRPHLRAVSPHL